MDLGYILVLSFVLIGYGLWKYFYYVYAKKNYSVVEGKIDDFYANYSYGSPVKIKYPIISYCVNGVQYSKKGWGKVIKDKVWKVYYDPSDPKKCILDNGHGIAYVIVGIVFLTIYCLIMF